MDFQKAAERVVNKMKISNENREEAIKAFINELENEYEIQLENDENECNDNMQSFIENFADVAFVGLDILKREYNIDPNHDKNKIIVLEWNTADQMADDPLFVKYFAEDFVYIDNKPSPKITDNVFKLLKSFETPTGIYNKGIFMLPCQWAKSLGLNTRGNFLWWYKKNFNNFQQWFIPMTNEEFKKRS